MKLCCCFCCVVVDDDLAATGSTVHVARLVTSTVKITVLVRVSKSKYLLNAVMLLVSIT